MTDKNIELNQALSDFFARYVNAYQTKYNHLPLIEHEPDWPSPCLSGIHQKGSLDLWQPITFDSELNFSNVERALEVTLHNDIKTFFTCFYSDALDAQCEHGDLTLLLVWNEDDFVRLQENLIGHALMKKKLKQPLTMFVGVTDEDDLILSVDNETGGVWVERVGKEPHKKLSDTLAQFIATLTPKIP